MSKTVQTETNTYDAGGAVITTMAIAENRLNTIIGAQTMLSSSPLTLEQRVAANEALVSATISVFPHLKNYMIEAEQRIATIEAKFNEELSELVSNVEAIVAHLTGGTTMAETKAELEGRFSPSDHAEDLAIADREPEPVIEAIRRLTKPASRTK